MKRILAALLAVCLLTLCAPVMEGRASSKYYITVDLTNQIVTVYDSENTADSHIVRQMICSTGRTATPTPRGTFYLPSKRQSSERSEWYYFPKFKCYAKWATRIRGGILFHSTLFTAAKKGPTSTSTRALGSKASHGCVRLKVADAKFIAQNCTAGTKCKIFASGKVNSSLRSKLKKKTFIRSNQTYDSYMGRKPKESSLPLSKGSTGTLVTQLQTRLKALGFYPGKANGTMGKSTITAVKAFQTASGLKKTSKVNQSLWNAIFANDAATGTAVTLSKGSTGPAVKTLQSNLSTLLLLKGSIDGSFGSQTAAAVKSYQTNFGKTVTGSANTSLQKEIASRAAQVRKDFGSSPYVLSNVTSNVKMARVKAKSGTRLRKSASTGSKSLKKLKYKATMRVLSEGKNWTKVQYGTRTGYVKKSCLDFYTQAVTEKGYVKVSVTPTPSPTPTPTPTPEIFIPTPTPSPTPTPEIHIPTEASLDAAAEDILVAEAQEVSLEDADEVLIFGTEPVDDADEAAGNDPDDGFEIEPEPTAELQDGQAFLEADPIPSDETEMETSED